jgi:hypothetical protein
MLSRYGQRDAALLALTVFFTSLRGDIPSRKYRLTRPPCPGSLSTRPAASPEQLAPPSHPPRRPVLPQPNERTVAEPSTARLRHGVGSRCTGGSVTTTAARDVAADTDGSGTFVPRPDGKGGRIVVTSGPVFLTVAMTASSSGGSPGARAWRARALWQWWPSTHGHAGLAPAGGRAPGCGPVQ